MVKQLAKLLTFENREAFHHWLVKHSETSGGVWLLFGKKGGQKTLRAQEALAEALCFGWIDGRMQRLDDLTYQKYFAHRTPKSKWSEKNKKLVQLLLEQGLVTEQGKAAIESAKKNGQWEATRPPAINETDIAALADLLQAYTPAYQNFLAMSPSVQKTYTRAYFDAKTEVGGLKRLAWLVDRLTQNLKPM